MISVVTDVIALCARAPAVARPMAKPAATMMRPPPARRAREEKGLMAITMGSKGEIPIKNVYAVIPKEQGGRQRRVAIYQFV
jgi:hypothetical protein